MPQNRINVHIESSGDILRKDQLELELHKEKRLIEDGVLREDNPLDVSEDFHRLCEACRRNDLKVCQEMIMEGANINAKDLYDYTPLILASLCGHYEVVQLLLESGALCERDTFQGERCLYNALNDRIRNLLLSYDYSKSTDPLQPLAAHITSLLSREQPHMTDIGVTTSDETFQLHRFILAARSPYFRKKLPQTPDTSIWKLPTTIAPQAFSIAVKYLYFSELPRDLGGGPGTGYTDSAVLAGADRISKHLEISSLSDMMLDNSNRRLARQRRQDEVEKGRDQLEAWFKDNVLRHSVVVDTEKADQVKWSRDNGIFADVLLQADEADDEDEPEEQHRDETSKPRADSNILGIPLGPDARPSRSPSRTRRPHKSAMFPCHKAMLIRSEFFLTMFSSTFREAQETAHLQIVPIGCTPEVMEIILTFLYTEKADFPLCIAVDVLFAADMLFLDKLKMRAAVVISTLGNGLATSLPTDQPAEDELDIYEILRAAWTTRVQRLEEFAARYIASRLESYIDDPEFAELVQESASRINKRQETDSIELLDDIRYYLSERFRLRFEDSGLEDMMDEDQAAAEAQQNSLMEHEHGLTDKRAAAPDDEGVDISTPTSSSGEASAGAGINSLQPGAVRTLDGEIAGDEFASDAVNYQILLGKIDSLLDRLKLDA